MTAFIHYLAGALFGMLFAQFYPSTRLDKTARIALVSVASVVLAAAVFARQCETRGLDWPGDGRAWFVAIGTATFLVAFFGGMEIGRRRRDE